MLGGMTPTVVGMVESHNETKGRSLMTTIFSGKLKI
jgi:hypothetical protein